MASIACAVLGPSKAVPPPAELPAAPSTLLVALVSAAVTAAIFTIWGSVDNKSSSGSAVQLHQTGTLSRLQQPATAAPASLAAVIQRGTDPHQLLSRVSSTTQQVQETLGQLQYDLAKSLGVSAPQQQQQSAVQQQPPAAGATSSAVPEVTVIQSGDALGGLPEKFLQQVLHAANYSQLGSAPLLDPHIPTKDYQQMKQAMRQQQDLFCRWVPRDSSQGVSPCTAEPSPAATRSSSSLLFQLPQPAHSG
jgi:hypothetical protein